MLVQVLDAQDVPHWVAWQGQDLITDLSGSLGAGAVPQVVAPANVERAGWLFQNTSANPMLLVEIPVTAIAVSAWTVYPGNFFPPPGVSYPIPTGAISVQGSGGSAAGDTFTYREWVNGPDE